MTYVYPQPKRWRSATEAHFSSTFIVQPATASMHASSGSSAELRVAATPRHTLPAQNGVTSMVESTAAAFAFTDPSGNVSIAAAGTATVLPFHQQKEGKVYTARHMADAGDVICMSQQHEQPNNVLLCCRRLVTALSAAQQRRPTPGGTRTARFAAAHP
jgi:hypothetical protein